MPAARARLFLSCSAPFLAPPKAGRVDFERLTEPESRGLAQDQVLVFEPLHLALEAQHLGFIRLLLGERLGRASGQLLIAPLAQLPRTDIQLRRDVSEWQATLDHTLNRMGLILGLI